MPIRSQEIDLYPETLLDHAPAGPAGQGQWWAIYTLSRREKELTRRLQKMQIGFYCPTIAKSYRSPAGRLRTSYIPLFSNYVFVFGAQEARHAAMTTGCVSRWMDVPDGDQLLRDLTQLRRVIELGVDLTPEGRLAVGTMVKVKSGPMDGIIGTIIERRGRKRLLVSVNFLQQGASAEVNDLDVEPFTP